MNLDEQEAEARAIAERLDRLRQEHHRTGAPYRDQGQRATSEATAHKWFADQLDGAAKELRRVLDPRNPWI